MIREFMGKVPSIDKSVFVAQGAVIIGDTSIGERSSVWFNAVIRADVGRIVIGRRTNVQDLCVLHTELGEGLTIGDDVTVGHRAILHGCRIGNRVLIGMGAVVMNGVTIGDDCIIGAGAVLTEGSEIPPRSLVLGIPAKIKRRLSDVDVSSLKGYAVQYAEFAARCKEEGLELSL